MIRAILASIIALAALPSAAYAQEAADAHADHTDNATEPAEPDQETFDTDADEPADDHATPSVSADGVIGTVPAPPPPDDHAADAYFDPAEMARTREALRRGIGAFSGSMVLFDLAEVQIHDGREGYRWEAEAWFGGDIDRLLIKTEGLENFGERIDDVEVQALWSHAITPFFNAQLGVRHDIVPNPSRTYAVAGIEGIAPYWFRISGQLFLSDNGDLFARIEGSYDERITQRLILQPRAEFNLSAQNVPEIGIGSGLSEFELGVRLRYEIRKEFAPYLGVAWSKMAGDTAGFARLAGRDPDRMNIVAGVRFWF